MGHPVKSKDRKPGVGIYYRPHPLDFAVLERMPKEGTTLGYHVLAATVKEMVDSLNSEQPEEAAKLKPSEVQARLRSMQAAGFVVSAPLLSNGGVLGWQRTKKGELHYEETTGRKLGPASIPRAKEKVS